jgi:cytoplasmic iron level regulating protein YaaA (DUF328/UPF0246 family)
MRILIITEDSATKLPQINKWTNKVQKGQDIQKDDELINLLKQNNLAIPSDDLADEKKYKTILKSYIRPAKYMFSGMFSEVRTFSNRLASIAPTDLYIISGRYGLINENHLIIPYSKDVKTIPELKNLNEKTRFVEKMQSLINDSTCTIFLLPSQYVKFFITLGIFDSIPKKHSIIVVTSSQNIDSLSKYPNFTVLSRKGVARLGYKNFNKIVEQIKDNRK